MQRKPVPKAMQNQGRTNARKCNAKMMENKYQKDHKLNLKLVIWLATNISLIPKFKIQNLAAAAA